jgi:hypothetical protein
MPQKLRLPIIITYIVLFFAAILYLNPSPAFANPPQSIVLAYNSDTQILSVTITHKSSFPSFHYIKYVEIIINGKNASSNTYENQPDNLTFTYTYKIPALEGDAFGVTGTCSLWGHKTVSYTVGKIVAAN